MSYPYLLLKKVLNFHCGFAVKVICEGIFLNLKLFKKNNNIFLVFTQT